MAIKKLYLRDERGSIMLMVGVTALILIAFVGLAIDVGRMYAARAELSRAVDAAALAGILELNGTPQGQTNATAAAQAILDVNEPGATSTIVPSSNKLSVDASKDVKMFFLSVIGINSAKVNGHAAAGLDEQPLDAVLVIDNTGSMVGTPIAEAKNAAKDFVDILVPATGMPGNTSVGIAPHRGCYNPPNGNSQCTPVSMVQGLTNNNKTLTDKINAIQSQGGSGTNVCLGLLKGTEILLPPASGAHTAANTRRYMVLLSDGDNNYTGSVAYGGGSLDAKCRPVTNHAGNQDAGGCGDPDDAEERELDELTYTRAQDLKDEGVEIFVVAFGVCDWDDGPTGPYCNASIWAGAGLGAPTGTDNARDQNLMKCIASSASGTNDHAYYADSASDLPAIFTQIAQQIAHRLVE